jgi:hypothetical protein
MWEFSTFQNIFLEAAKQKNEMDEILKISKTVGVDESFEDDVTLLKVMF